MHIKHLRINGKEFILRAVYKVMSDLDELLTFYSQPPEWWESIRTTNVIERLNREIRGRFRPIGAAYDQHSTDKDSVCCSFKQRVILETKEKIFLRRSIW